jgi:hypothetical protein
MLGYALLCTPMSMLITVVVNTHKLNNIKYHKLSITHPNSKLYSLTQKLITQHNHTNLNTIHFTKANINTTHNKLDSFKIQKTEFYNPNPYFFKHEIFYITFTLKPVSALLTPNYLQ